jgi:hypothetical protein
MSHVQAKTGLGVDRLDELTICLSAIHWYAPSPRMTNSNTMTMMDMTTAAQFS